MPKLATKIQQNNIAEISNKNSKDQYQVSNYYCQKQQH